MQHCREVCDVYVEKIDVKSCHGGYPVISVEHDQTQVKIHVAPSRRLCHTCTVRAIEVSTVWYPLAVDHGQYIEKLLEVLFTTKIRKVCTVAILAQGKPSG